MNWSDALSRLPPLLASHIVLAAAALFLGMVIALPMGVVAARHPRFGRVALGFASLVQTIPSLALLALFYPLLLALSGVVRVPALGFLPSLLALALYALLPILRNTVIALTSIDPEIIEAADGIGMTRGQKLWIVQAPLALPVVMGGIRTAAVWTIGAATLSTTVGQPSLGDIIFSGLQTQNWVLVVTGCVAAAILALVVDAMLALAEHGLATRRRWLWVVPLLVAVLVPVAITVARTAPASTITIGAKNFSEQYILARVIGHRLEAAGYRVRYKENLGSAVVFDALGHDDVDVYVEYAGTLWTNAMKRSDVPARPILNRAVGDWTLREHGVTSLGPLGFENAYALAVPGELARRRGLRTLANLTAAAPDLTLGGDLEFLDRPEWAAIRQAYALDFRATRAFAPTFMYAALKSHDADVISAFSSDGRIAADGLVVLGDPRNAIPGYDALLLVGPKAGHDAAIVAALRSLVGAIPVNAMRHANLMVDGPQKASADVAAAWLEQAIAAKGAR
ncbi:ABC transporter permease/substrate-binding protein [Sphingomonas sp.]|uniref:ABC transporter permease/substrate-binding protein n=1 Tax=Sphingomonas sp. TaxID=28214 RepID=UPI0025FF8E01|nr:ABC transporter permease/substrate-binding protein [Sphingomonas sp.]